MGDPRRRRHLLAGAAAIVLAAGWLWLSRSSEPAEAGTGPVAVSERDEHPTSHPAEAGPSGVAATGDGGTTLRVRVVDLSDKPVAGAWVVGVGPNPRLAAPCPCLKDADEADEDDGPDDDPLADSALSSACECEAATLALLDLRVDAPVPLEREKTDREGWAQLRADAGIAVVWAEAPGQVSSTLDVADAPGDPMLRLGAAQQWRIAVVDEEEHPVAGVRARFFSRQPLQELPLRSDQGLFISEAAAAQDLALALAAPGFRATVVQTLPSIPHEERDGRGQDMTTWSSDTNESWKKRGDVFVVTLFAPRSIRGRVTSEGRPVAGAQVTTEATSIAPVQTDSRGRFALENLAATRDLRLMARAPGRVGMASVAGLDQDPEVEVEIALVESASVSVTAVDASTGARLPEAEVKLEPPVEMSSLHLIHPPLAGARVFPFEDLPPGDYDLQVSEAEHAPVERELHLRPGERQRLEIKLQRGLSLSGRVRDAAGKPVVGADVQANVPSDAEPSQPLDASTTSDAEGRFTLHGLPAGRLRISAQHEGFVGGEVEAEAGGAEVTVELLQQATLEGVVSGVQGPARGVVVVVLAVDGGQQGERGDRTDVQGHYSIDRETEGQAVVSVEKSGAGMETEVAVTLRAGANHLDIHLEPGPMISGRVLDANDQPVEGARVHGQPVNPTPMMMARRLGARQVTSDAQGNFALIGLETSVAEYAVGASTETASTPNNPRTPVGTTGVVLHLSTRPRLRGRVLSASGGPVTRFQVNGTEFSPADGAFELWGYPHQRVAELTGPFVGQEVPVGDPDGGVIDLGDLTVEEGITLNGVVLTPRGRGARGCQVSSRTDWEVESPGPDPFHDAQTDTAGRFALPHLHPGHYLITAQCDGAVALDVPVLVQPGMGVATLHVKNDEP